MDTLFISGNLCKQMNVPVTPGYNPENYLNKLYKEEILI